MSRLILARLLLAMLIVLPPVVFWTRLTHAEHQIHALAHEQACGQQGASEALIRIAAASPPKFFTANDRLLLTTFVQRPNRYLQAASSKACTAKEMHLPELASP